MVPFSQTGYQGALPRLLGASSMTPFASMMQRIRHALGRHAGPRREVPPYLESLEDRWLLSYTFRLLGTLSGSDAVAQAISGKHVVGQAAVDATDTHAVLWSARTATARDLGTLGGPNSAALAVNAAGTVVGWANDSADPDQKVAFIWDRAEGMQSLGLDGMATAINDAGQVVGQTADGQAFVMESPTPLLLTSLTGRSRASAINNAGLVAGWNEIDLHGRGLGHFRAGDAWIWDNGTQTDLGVLPFPGIPQHSEAYALNDAGQVVGTSGIFVYRGQHPGWLVSRAVLWQPDQGIIDLGTLGDGANSAAYAINNAGDVVGTSGGRAFLYHAGVLIDLNQFNPLVGPNDTLVAATGINDAGQIVGYATIGSTTEAFLLTPDLNFIPPAVESVVVAPEGTQPVPISVLGRVSLGVESVDVAVEDIQPVLVHSLRRHRREFIQLASKPLTTTEVSASVTAQAVPIPVHARPVHWADRIALPVDADPVEAIAVVDGLTLTPWSP
jgi:probable HAF family extracellular repeat protein